MLGTPHLNLFQEDALTALTAYCLGVRDTMYEADAAWHNEKFHWGPMASRRVAVEHLVLNIEAGMPLVHVQFKDPAVPARLLLLVRKEERPPDILQWTWRPCIPFRGYLDVVLRIGIMTRKQTVIFTDGTFPPVARLGTVSDRVRLLAVFVRWRNALLARQEARAVALRVCLLRLRNHQVLRVLVDRCEA